MTDRGVRNNNPGNIRHSTDHWAGMATEQTDPAFVQFTDPAYGIRALVVVLTNYQDVHGLKTLAEMVARWAPPTDHNDTRAYLTSMCRRTGYPPDFPIDMHAVVVAAKVAGAIIEIENSGYQYPQAVLLRGVALAEGKPA